MKIEYLPITAGTTQIEVPAGAQLLCIVDRHAIPTVFFASDPSAPKVPRKITVVDTIGDCPHPKNARYLGTAVTQGGHHVFHVFEHH